MPSDSAEDDSAITQPDRRCLFVAEETTGYGSEKVNEYDDMSIVVCENTREVVVKPENALKKRAKVCREHADYLVSEDGWEYVNRQKRLVTDGGSEPSAGVYR